MKAFLLEHGFDIWQSVVVGYATPKGRLKSPIYKKINKRNVRELSLNISGISPSEKKRNNVENYTSSKEIRNKL